jgi:hypothetical protein
MIVALFISALARRDVMDWIGQKKNLLGGKGGKREREEKRAGEGREFKERARAI